LAGKSAKCFANSYPLLTVGSGSDSKGNGVKRMSNEADVVKKDLNPKFFKTYELDSLLPYDCNLTVKMMNKGKVLDDEIGKFEIDLEDRLFGNIDVKRIYSYSC